jgi:hypothetical protein
MHFVVSSSWLLAVGSLGTNAWQNCHLRRPRYLDAFFRCHVSLAIVLMGDLRSVCNLTRGGKQRVKRFATKGDIAVAGLRHEADPG